MAAVYNGRRSVGEFSQCGRQAVAIARGSREVDERISLRGMVGQQPDRNEHLAEAAFHALEEFSASGGVSGSSSRSVGIRAIFNTPVVLAAGAQGDHKSFQKIRRIFWRGSCLRNHTASGGAGFNAYNRRDISWGNGFSPTSRWPTTCPKWMFLGHTRLVGQLNGAPAIGQPGGGGQRSERRNGADRTPSRTSAKS